MKKHGFLIALMLVLATALFANDAYFFMAGGNVAQLADKSERVPIEMRAETIHITLYRRFYEVSVDFDFYNSGEGLEVSVGFPFFKEGVKGEGKIWDFMCWTNGVETEFSTNPIEKNWDTRSKLEYANVRKVFFPKNAHTNTKVRYKSDYGTVASFALATYLYGTGASWKGDIGNIRLIIENNDVNDIIEDVKMEGRSIKSLLQRTADNAYELNLQNVAPANFEAVFEIELSDVIGHTGPKNFPAYFPFTKAVVEKSELKWYRKDQLRLVRNTIYALHGYEFKSKDLRDFFESENWKNWNPPYEVNPHFSEAEFSDIERANIRNILEDERSR